MATRVGRRDSVTVGSREMRHSWECWREVSGWLLVVKRLMCVLASALFLPRSSRGVGFR